VKTTDENTKNIVHLDSLKMKMDLK